MRYVVWLIFLVVTGNAWAGVVIQSSIDDGPWMKKSAIYPLKGQKICLSVSKTSAAHIRWHQIFPDISKIYKNANHPWEANPYQWVGFGKIDYHRKEAGQFRGQWEICPFDAQDPDAETRKPFFDGKWRRYFSWFLSDEETPSGYYHKGIGTFWFQAEVEKEGKTDRSPGIEDSDKRGLSPKVFRVSIRDGEGYLGYLTSFFNVPGIFGSVPYQSNHHIGADCADVLIAAYGKWKGTRIKKNYNVAMLVNKFSVVEEFDMKDGMPDKQVKWKTSVRPGDFIAVRYAPGRQYQHIGALFRDANGDGFLGGQDMVLHAGPFPLDYAYLKEGYFDGHVKILRPR